MQVVPDGGFSIDLAEVWTEYALGCGGQTGHRCVGVIQPIRVTVTK